VLNGFEFRIVSLAKPAALLRRSVFRKNWKNEILKFLKKK